MSESTSLRGRAVVITGGGTGIGASGGAAIRRRGRGCEIVGFLPCLEAETVLLPSCPAGAEAIARKLSAAQSSLDELTVTRDHLAALLATLT